MSRLHHSLSTSENSCLIFIHGFLGTTAQWEDISQHFQAHFQILKIALPGHGAKDDFTNGYCIEELAQEIILLIEEHQIKNIHLIGHSMGGYIAAALAVKIPKYVKSLILINSIAGKDTAARIETRNRSLNLIQKFKSAFVNMAVTNLFNNEERKSHAAAIEHMKLIAQDIPLSAIEKAIIAMRDRNSTLELLKKLDTSIIYIYSTKDGIVASDRVEEEVAVLKASSIKLQAGHMSLITHPDEITTHLKTILLSRC